MTTPLVPEDAVFPDEESRKMAEDIAKELQEKEQAENQAKPEEKPEEKPDQKPDEEKDEAEPEKPESKDEEKSEDEDKDEGDGKTVQPWQLAAMRRQFSKQIEELKDAILSANKPEATPEEKSEVADKAQGVDEKIAAFAEKHGWDSDMLKDLKDALGVGQQLPAELLEAAEAAKVEKENLEQERGFTNELKDVLTAHPEFKGIDSDKLKELAFSDKYLKYSLEDVIALNRTSLVPNTGKPSLESGRGSTRHDTSIDLTTELSADVIAQLTPEQFDTYSENMAKKSRSVLIRDGRPVKE